MLEASFHRVDDKVGGLEVHVGDPQRNQVVAAVTLLEGVVFQAVGAVTIHNLVEIVLFHIIVV